MDLLFEYNNNELNISFDKICLILGGNNQGKTNLLNYIERGLIGELDNFLINGIKVYKNDYHVIKITDEMSFESEFKFSKFNEIRKFIYDDILDELVGNDKVKDMSKNINNIFNSINIEIQSFIDSNINNNSSGNLLMKTEIENIDKILEKFTNIYIDNNILKSSSKSKSRELLLIILILIAKKKYKENIVILIDSIDFFMKNELLLKCVNIIKNLTGNNNIHFIITASDPLLFSELFSETIYKVRDNNFYKLSNVKDLIKECIIRDEYSRSKFNFYDDFYIANKSLILDEELEFLYKKYFINNLDRVGLLYVVNEIMLMNEFNYELKHKYLIYENQFMKNMYAKMCEKLAVDIINKDMI